VYPSSTNRIEELEEELKSEKAKSDELLEQQRQVGMSKCVVVYCVLGRIMNNDYKNWKRHYKKEV